jgi:hypothetical protein
VQINFLFWLFVEDDYPSLSDRAVKVLLPFVTTYLGGNEFSAVAVMKKYQSRLIIEKELELPFHQ